MMFFHVLSFPFDFCFRFFYFSSIPLTKFFRSLCHTSTSSKRIVICEDLSDDSDLWYLTEEHAEKKDLVADIILGGEALLFLSSTNSDTGCVYVNERENSEDDISEEVEEIFVEEQWSVYGSPPTESESGDDREKVGLEDSVSDPVNMTMPMDIGEKILEANDAISEEKDKNGEGHPSIEDPPPNENDNLPEDGNHLDSVNSEAEAKKIQSQKHEGEENFGDSFTVGSTSKSSCEWRSSTNYRDSETEDPFSSSSRRSSSNWESFTVFRKYDEEMMFFDRISAEKLSETESLRAEQIYPRSISQRIVHKFATRNKQLHEEIGRNPFQELESAYVAQICLTWEAINWNYKNFRQLKALQHEEEDLGCSGRIAQQFQQFQVLLQRFIENEPYENGQRPEVYARARISTPKLLQVPEFRGSEAGQSKEITDTNIPSAEFLKILEDIIRTFMNFLKADKEKHCRIFRAFLKKNQSSVDSTLLELMRKTNKRKKLKLKGLQRRKKCLRKRKLKEEEEMEILMGLIDLKVVSRVLRMAEISGEQLHWCEVKMNKVRLWEGNLQRDSSPLFFPAHSLTPPLDI